MSDETTRTAVTLHTPDELEAASAAWFNDPNRTTSSGEDTRTTWRRESAQRASRLQVDSFRAHIEHKRLQRQAEQEAREAELRERGVACFTCEDTGTVLFMSHWHGCPDCEVGRPIREEAERKRQREVVLAVEAWHEQMAETINIPARFWESTLDTFPRQDAPTLKAIRRWLAEPRPSMRPGLFLSGGFGQGKTGLMVGLLREVVAQYQPEPENCLYWAGEGRDYGWFVTTTALLESLRPNDERRENLMEVYQQTRNLVIDDIGAERLTEWGVDRLFEIVNHRHNELLPMLITSNLSPDALAKRINKQIGDQSGDRIVERIIESCTVIRFDTKEPNLRLTGAA